MTDAGSGAGGGTNVGAGTIAGINSMAAGGVGGAGGGITAGISVGSGALGRSLNFPSSVFAAGATGVAGVSGTVLKRTGAGASTAGGVAAGSAGASVVSDDAGSVASFGFSRSFGASGAS